MSEPHPDRVTVDEFVATGRPPWVPGIVWIRRADLRVAADAPNDPFDDDLRGSALAKGVPLSVPSREHDPLRGDGIGRGGLGEPDGACTEVHQRRGCVPGVLVQVGPGTDECPLDDGPPRRLHFRLLP